MRRNMFVLPEPWLSTEDQVLLLVACPQLDCQRRERLTHLLTLPLDWQSLIERADQHGVSALLHHHLQGLSHVPPSAWEALHDRSRQCVIWNLRLRHELKHLLAVFHRAGIPVMPLKGPVLAELLYGDEGLRPTNDLDLLVQPQDIEKAEFVLVNAGYREAVPHEQEADLYHYSFVKEGADEADIVVELHWDLNKSHIARLDIREIWLSASRGCWQGQEISTMAPEHLLLYLCLHAVKDGLGSLKHVLDIALVIERFAEALPWETMIESVRVRQIKTQVYLSLLYSCNFFGIALPEDFLARICPRRSMTWCLAQTLLAWRGGVLHSALPSLGPPLQTLLVCLWEDSLRGKLQHLYRLLFPSRGFRSRRTFLSSSTSFYRWYPAWVWHVVSQAAHLQMTNWKSWRRGARQIHSD